MEYATIQLTEMPNLTSPTMIIGLRGWGNALEVSSGMAAHFVDQHRGRSIGRLNSDACYRYDDIRPVVNIQDGRLQTVDPPGGNLFAVQSNGSGKDLIILIGDEPNLNWYRFSNELVDLAVTFGSTAVFSIGSIFDRVLHTDRVISAVTTGIDAHEIFERYAVAPIDYQGPSAVHTLILEICRKRGMAGASLWCHCPAYLRDATHYGVMIHLARLLGAMIPQPIQTAELQARWEALEIEIEQMIGEDEKLACIVEEIRRRKRACAWQEFEQKDCGQGNVIKLEDFRI